MAIQSAPIVEEVVGGRKAWVTLITNPNYIAGLLTLHRTLISVSSYPLVVMTTPSLPLSSREIISTSGIEMIEVEYLQPSKSQHTGSFDPHFLRFQETWTKIRVFGLIQFERIIMIDSDMIFLKSMDELFDMDLPSDEWIAASPACVCNPLKIKHYPDDWIPSNCQLSLQSTDQSIESTPIPNKESKRTSHLLNSGLVVFQPSLKILNKLIHHLNTSPNVANYKFPDQDLIAEVFSYRWKPLPWWCNALKTQRAVHKNFWKDEEVRLIHYILDKPWNHRPPSLPPHRSLIDQLPPTPITPSNSSSFSTFSFSPANPSEKRRPLPEGLLEYVKNKTPEQDSLTNYDSVHSWWWIVYEDLLDDWKSCHKLGWKEFDSYVTR